MEVEYGREGVFLITQQHREVTMLDEAPPGGSRQVGHSLTVEETGKFYRWSWDKGEWIEDIGGCWEDLEREIHREIAARGDA